MQSSATALSSNLTIKSQPLDKLTPLSPSCPHGDLQIKNTLFVVLDQQQRAPFPGSELSHQLLVKLQNSFWFLGSVIYFIVSFEWVCKNYYTNIMFIYRLIRIFKVFYFFIEQQHFADAFLAVHVRTVSWADLWVLIERDVCRIGVPLSLILPWVWLTGWIIN